jgi:hypothetical protein
MLGETDDGKGNLLAGKYVISVETTFLVEVVYNVVL